MIKSFMVNHRIGFSQCIGLGALFLLMVSGSFWSLRHPFIGQCLSIMGWLLSGIGALGRIWCAVYIAGYKNESLVTAGPYSMCRHPLYFFSMAGAAGVGFATETFVAPFVVLIFFMVYYPAVIRNEEKHLSLKHSRAYQSYFDTVPAFIPQPGKLFEPENYMVNPKVFKRHLMDAVWFIWLCGLVSMLARLHTANFLPRWILVF